MTHGSCAARGSDTPAVYRACRRPAPRQRPAGAWAPCALFAYVANQHALGRPSKTETEISAHFAHRIERLRRSSGPAPCRSLAGACIYWITGKPDIGFCPDGRPTDQNSGFGQRLPHGVTY